jgi:hypothetical protein
MKDLNKKPGKVERPSPFPFFFLTRGVQLCAAAGARQASFGKDLIVRAP